MKPAASHPFPLMDTDNPIIQLCTRDNYEACTSAHHLAHFQDEPKKSLRWNQRALRRADLVTDEGSRLLPAALFEFGARHMKWWLITSRHTQNMNLLPSWVRCLDRSER